MIENPEQAMAVVDTMNSDQREAFDTTASRLVEVYAELAAIASKWVDMSLSIQRKEYTGTLEDFELEFSTFMLKTVMLVEQLLNLPGSNVLSMKIAAIKSERDALVEMLKSN